MTNPSPQNKNGHNKQYVSTVVVSRPGIMRQSLRAMLGDFPAFSVAASAGDGLTALNLVQRHQPRLLVIDSNLLDEEVEALLVAVKLYAPVTRCLACVQSSQREALLLAAGADAVILRDSSARQWQETLLLLSPGAAF